MIDIVYINNSLKIVIRVIEYRIKLAVNARDDSLYTKLMKGKALRKHSLHEKTAASVLLKLFISSNE